MPVEQPNITEAISTIEQMYSNQLTHLTWTIGIFLTFIGVVIPIFLVLLQRWSIRLREQKLRSELVEKFEDISKKNEEKNENLRNEISEEFRLAKEQLEMQLAEKEAKLEKKIQHAQDEAAATSLILQGAVQFSAGLFPDAAVTYARAACACIQTNDEPHFQSIMEFLITLLGSKLNKSSLENEDDLNSKLDDLPDRIEEFNENSRYDNLLRNFNRALRECRDRESDPENVPESATPRPR